MSLVSSSYLYNTNETKQQLKIIKIMNSMTVKNIIRKLPVTILVERLSQKQRTVMNT